MDIKLSQNDFRDFIFCKNYYYYRCLYPNLSIRDKVKKHLLDHIESLAPYIQRKFTDMDVPLLLQNYNQLVFNSYVPPAYLNANNDIQKWLYYIFSYYGDGFSKDITVDKPADLQHDGLQHSGINPVIDLFQDMIIIRPKEIQYITLINDSFTHPEMHFVTKPSIIFKVYFEDKYPEFNHRNVIFNLLTNTIRSKSFYKRTMDYISNQFKAVALDILNFKKPLVMGIMAKCYLQCPYIGICKPGGKLDTIEIKRDGKTVLVIKDGKVYKIVNGKEVLVDDQPMDMKSE